MNEDGNSFYHLDRSGRLMARIVLSPRFTAYTAVTVMFLGSWFVILLMAARTAPGNGGPGLPMPQGLAQINIPGPLEKLLALCLAPVPPGELGAEGFAALVLMWFLMAVAMMLPSAAPLVRTYCEIADTAKAASKPVVHPLWLVAGYLLVWLVTAVAFAGTGVGIGLVTGSGSSLSPLAIPVSAGALVLAGLYQFSGLKEACLTKCRNPFSTLFANWSDRRLLIFNLGMKQGLWCLGCCWALMMIMFAVGVMNVFWMALLALFTVMEKTGKHTALSRAAGVLLLVWALVVILISL